MPSYLLGIAFTTIRPRVHFVAHFETYKMSSRSNFIISVKRYEEEELHFRKIFRFFGARFQKISLWSKVPKILGNLTFKIEVFLVLSGKIPKVFGTLTQSEIF